MAVKVIRAVCPATEDTPEMITEGHYDFGDNTAEAVSVFGEAVVYSRWIKSVTVDAQAFLRRCRRAGDTAEEAEGKLQSWKPTISKPGRTKLQKAEDAFLAMSGEEQDSYIKKLRGLVKERSK